MSFIFLAIVIGVVVCIRALISYYIFRKYPGLLKWLGYYVLALSTCVFVFFPSCILLGNQTCWNFDVATHKIVLLTSSTIILLLCAWVWYEIFKYPKIDDESRVSSVSKVVAGIIITVTIFVLLVIIIFGTSRYWAPLVGH